MAKFFVSYSHDDSEFVLKLATDLRRAGVDIWIDQFDIRPGELWDKSIERALQDCRAMIVVLSPASVDSRNVMNEVIFTLEKNKPIIPVLHRPCSIPLPLLAHQRIDFTGDYGTGVASLLKACGAPGPGPKPPPRPWWRKYARPIAGVGVGIVIAVAILMAALPNGPDEPPPFSGERSPEIHVDLSAMDPCGIGQHVRWAIDEIARDLQAFKVRVPVPVNPGANSSRSDTSSAMRVDVRVGCFPSANQGMNEMRVRVEGDETVTTKANWPSPWQSCAGGVEIAPLYPGAAETEDKPELAVKTCASILTDGIRTSLLQSCPPHGHIDEEPTGSTVVLDIGKYHGVCENDVFDVLSQSDNTEIVGSIRVDYVGYTSSEATIITGNRERMKRQCRVARTNEPTP